MQDQIKSVESTHNKQPSSLSVHQNPAFAGMDKTYDDCDTQKGLISVLMKLLPITLYLILKFVTDQQISLFIIICLMLAIDLWTTKNILGPKLVGLKWFSIQDQNDCEKWCFASCKETRIISKANALFFWIPQIFAILFWIIITLLNVITLGLFWAALAIYSVFLLVLNFVFFLQCKGDHQDKVNFLTKKLGFQVFKNEQLRETGSGMTA